MTIEARLKSIRAEDLMTRFAITVSEDQTIVDLANLFIRFKISGIPVVNGGGEITGIVTAVNLFDHMREVMEKIESQTGAEQCDCNTSVVQIMTRDVVTITEQTTLYEMIKLMCEQHIHTFPVVRGGHLVGVVGRRDVMNACYTTICCRRQ